MKHTIDFCVLRYLTFAVFLLDCSQQEHKEGLARLLKGESPLEQKAEQARGIRKLRMGMKKSNGGSNGGKSSSKGKSSSCPSDYMFCLEDKLFLAPTQCTKECVQAGTPITITTCSSASVAQQWNLQQVEGSIALTIESASMPGMCMTAPNCDEDSVADIILGPCSSPFAQWLYVNTNFMNYGCYTNQAAGEGTRNIDFDACLGGTPFLDDDGFYYGNALFLDQCHI